MYKLFDKLNYDITPNLLTNISEINKLWGIILGSNLDKQKISELERQKTIEITHYSTKIEGNNISLHLTEDFLIDQKPIAGSVKDKQEIQNIYNTLNIYKNKKIDWNKFDHKDIHKLHKIITDNILPDSWIGNYRDQQNAVKSGSLLVYMTPEAKDVDIYMSQLLLFVQQNHNKIDPIIISFIIHHAILLIHPYMDGNGRIARALQIIYLRSKGFGKYKIYSIDTQCQKNLQEYYDNIHIGSNRYTIKEKNTTNFLEFMSLMMVYSLNDTISKL